MPWAKGELPPELVPQQSVDPTLGDMAKAAFENDTIIGASMSTEEGLPDRSKSTDYNAWLDMTEEERLDQNFYNRAVYADSADELNAIRSQQNRERRNRETLAKGGFAGFVIGTGVQLLEPVNYLPVGGAAFAAYRNGGSILKRATMVGAANAGVVSGQEAVLHGLQMERTFGESATNVGAAAFLGGILGIPAAKAGQEYSDLVRQIDDTMNPEPKVADGLSIFSEQQIKDAGSAGAKDLAAGEVKGAIVRNIAKKLRFDPLTRTVTSDNPETRKTANRLAENMFELEGGNVEAVETRIKQWQSNYYRAASAQHEAFLDYTKRESTGVIDGVKNKIMGRKKFDEAVGYAVAHGSDDPIIEKAAAAWRSEFYEPLKQAAIDSKMLDPEVMTSTAKYYRNRVWKSETVAAKYPEFVGKVSSWLKSQNEQKVAVQGRIETLADDYEVNAENIAKTQGQLNTAQKQLSETEKQLEEVRRVEKSAIEDAFESSDRSIKRLAEIKETRDKLKKERETTTVRGRKTKIDAEIKKLNEEQRQIKQRGKRERGKRSQIGKGETRSRDRLNTLQDRLSGLRSKVETLEAEMQARMDKDAAIVKDLEAAVSSIPSKVKKEVMSAFKQRGKPAEQMTKVLRKTVRNIIDRDYQELTDVDFDDLAGQIASRIMRSPDGMLPYDYRIGDQVGSDGAVTNKYSSPFQSRTFLIPDEEMKDFLENDIQVLAQVHLGKAAPDIEIQKEFGDVEMKAELAAIDRGYREQMGKAKTEAERSKLDKQRQADMRDIAAMRDRLRNRYGMVDPDNPVERMFRTARDLNYMRLLGGVVAASIPDVARIVAANGMYRAFGKTLVPMIANIKKNKPLRDEIHNMAIGIDDWINGRANIIADINDFSRGGTKFERGVRAMSNRFSNVNLMNQWTRGVKTWAAAAMQSTLIEQMIKKGGAKQLKRLGINDVEAENITKLLKQHATQVEGGNWMSNRDAWNNPELERLWASALRKEVDRIIVTPGQEKPLFMSTQFGSTLFQFRSFMMSATTRVLLAGMQGQDAKFVQGVIGMITLGAISYAFKEWDAGREVSDDPKVWIAEGIDRSGMLGIFMEANNTIEKVTGNRMGMRSLMGVAAPASRYASRSALDSLIGPTFGLAGDILKVASAATGEFDWEESDTRAIRRLIPGQNLSILRQAFDKIEQNIGE